MFVISETAEKRSNLSESQQEKVCFFGVFCLIRDDFSGVCPQSAALSLCRRRSLTDAASERTTVLHRTFSVLLRRLWRAGSSLDVIRAGAYEAQIVAC